MPVRVWLRATASTHYERAPRFSKPRRNALLKEGSKNDKADTHKLADLLRTRMLQIGDLHQFCRCQTVARQERRIHRKNAMCAPSAEILFTERLFVTHISRLRPRRA